MGTNIAGDWKRRVGSGMKIISVLISLLIVYFKCYTQFYPSPKPIKSDKITGLQTQLKKSKPDTNKVNLLLDLAAAYYNKPVKKEKDLLTAMSFAKAAGSLGRVLVYRDGYNNSWLLMANIFVLQKNIASAENLLTEVADATTKIDLLMILGFAYRQRENEKKDQDLERAIAYAQQARELSIKHGLKGKELMAARIIAAVHGDKKDPGAEKEMLELVNLYRENGNPNLHYIYIELAWFHFLMGNKERALYYSGESLKSMQNTGDTASAADFYAIHSTININNDELKTGLDFAHKAIDSYKILPGVLPLSGISEVIPARLRKLRRYEEAIEFMKELSMIFPAQSLEDEIRNTETMAHIYREMKQYDKAEKYYRIALALKRKNGNPDYRSYSDLGQLFVESGQYEKAKPYLDKVLGYRKLLGDNELRHLYYLRFLADSATGNYLTAIRHQNQFQSIEDHNLERVKEKEVQNLNVQYETEKKRSEIKIKDQDIKILEQSAVLQQIKLRQAMMIRNFTIGGIIMLLIIAGLLYMQYLHKQKTALVITDTNNVISQKNQAITQKNEALEHLVAEKEWLLKEVQHRVKNNLHTVICLLESQAAFLQNDALTAIQDSQHRIYAMSLIHQKLYQTDSRQIDMQAYLRQFIGYLRDSFGICNRIYFLTDIAHITLSAAQAVPVALIVNEAVTNSIKYAFPDNRKGEISISLFKTDEQTIELDIADNGIGMDPGLINRESNSMGIDLIKGLSKEIHANLEFRNNNGTRILITFMHDSLMAGSGAHLIMIKEKEVFS